MRRTSSRWAVLAPLGAILASSAGGCLSSTDPGPVAPGIDAGSIDGSICGSGGCFDGATSTPDGATSTPDASNGPIPDGGLVADANGPDTGAVGPGDVFVDPTAGLDSNVGSVAAPLKTLAKAFAVVAAGATVWLADGTFDKTSQGSATLAIPNGVRVKAVHGGLAVLSALPATANGASAAIDGVVFDNGASLTANNAAAPGAVVLTNLAFKNGVTTSSTLTVGGQTKVTMSASTFSGNLHYGAINVGTSGELELVGVTLDAGGVGAPGFGASLITASGTSKLTLDGVTIKSSLTPGLGINGSSAVTPIQVTLKNGTTFDTVGSNDNCAAGASVIIAQNATVLLDGATITGSPSAGICVRDGAGTHVSVTLQNGASLTKNYAGVLAEPGTSAEAAIRVDGATITGNTTAGISWTGGGSLDLSAATLTGNGTGLYIVPTTLTAKVRGSTLTGNANAGVQVIETADNLTLDLGTAASPGGNAFGANTKAGLLLNMPATASVTATGNTWNASIQSADAAGHYTAGTVVTGPATGTNYSITNASKLTL